MERKIKFRCWDGVSKVWCNPSKVLSIDNDGELYPALDLEKDILLMQFTGLLDKFGKEIYEGDLIKDIKGDVREVKYIDNGFWCEYPNGDHYFPANGYREIIGNIMENPDLSPHSPIK